MSLLKLQTTLPIFLKCCLSTHHRYFQHFTHCVFSPKQFTINMIIFNKNTSSTLYSRSPEFKKIGTIKRRRILSSSDDESPKKVEQFVI